jgi:superfamily II DNA or RNA helicase
VQIYSGALNAAEKEAVLAATHSGAKSEVLLVQLQSGGVGLNLQHFNKIMFTGPWWTKALMEQAVGRAVRIGQTKQVMVYHLKLAAEDESDTADEEEKEGGLNIDNFISEKAHAKGELCGAVLGGANKTVLVTDLST